MQDFVNFVSKERMKNSSLLHQLDGSLPWQGIIPEIMEEYLNNAIDRGFTIASRATGVEAINLGRESFIGDARENKVIVGASILLSSLGNSVRLVPALAK